MGKLEKPTLYRLTLTTHALVLIKPRLRHLGLGASLRPDGRVDVLVSFGLRDQLQTAAIANENFSDTIIRLVLGKKPAGSAGST